MAIKEVPVKLVSYYDSMKTYFNEQYEAAKKLKDETECHLKDVHSTVFKNIDSYKSNFNVNINKFKEFTENKYITGYFLKSAKGLYLNRKNDYTLVSELYELFNCALLQKKVYDIDKKITVYSKILDLTLGDYNHLLRVYFNEVHKKMILEGYGYGFSERIGWLCINRVVRSRKAPMLDFVATKNKKRELIAQGKRIYNKEEADWCLRNGIEYKAEDHRVYRTDEYYYEIPLLACKLPNGEKFKFEGADYRHSNYRGKTHADMLEECNNDPNKICELPVDLKTKLTLCDKVDKTLYVKFIRNENQKAHNFRQARREN